MNVALWIVAGLLALVFLAVGIAKVVVPKDKQYEKGMKYVEDLRSGQVKGIGVVEVLGAIGLIVPAFVAPLAWLVPVAALGLAVIMVGAVVTHVRRKEPFLPPLVLGVAALFVVVGRFWIAPY